MRRWQAALWLLCGLLPAAALAAPKEIVLYSFSGNRLYGPDGDHPVGSLIMDPSSGVLYGTTVEGGKNSWGTLFSLTPPAPGKTRWTEKVLVDFDDRDGAYPVSGLVMDRSGNLYGTTPVGGGPPSYAGMVFELVRPAPGMTRWREKTLYRFSSDFGPRGSTPLGGLVLDVDGNLYGTTFLGGFGNCGNCGMVFRLAPPQGGATEWTETKLYRFKGPPDGWEPVGGLTIGSGGVLYGATGFGGQYGDGTLFSLAPPATAGSAWTETVIHSFSSVGTSGWTPVPGVIADVNGDLFGAGRSAGTRGVVFSLTPPGAGRSDWVEDLLHVFRGPDGAWPVDLTAGPNGVLFGATLRGGPYSNCPQGLGCGVVFKLTPPEAGHTRWQEATVYALRRRADGGARRLTLISDANGNLYGTTKFGGAYGKGTVFEIVP